MTYTNNGDVLNTVCEAGGLIFGVFESHCVCSREIKLEENVENFNFFFFLKN